MYADRINSVFEVSAGALLCLNVWRLYKDKQLRGVSALPVGLFVLWGWWNLYFYPAVGAWWSFGAGLLVVAVNTIWLGQIAYYGIRKKRRND